MNKLIKELVKKNEFDSSQNETIDLLSSDFVLYVTISIILLFFASVSGTPEVGGSKMVLLITGVHVIIILLGFYQHFSIKKSLKVLYSVLTEYDIKLFFTDEISFISKVEEKEMDLIINGQNDYLKKLLRDKLLNFQEISNKEINNYFNKGYYEDISLNNEEENKIKEKIKNYKKERVKKSLYNF
jgi:flagellar motor component MotA